MSVQLDLKTEKGQYLISTVYLVFPDVSVCETVVFRMPRMTTVSEEKHVFTGYDDLREKHAEICGRYS